DRTRAPRPPAGRSLAADQEAAETADAPAALELLGRGVDDRLGQIGAGVVDDHGGLAQIALHGCEEIEHGFLVASIADIGAGTGLLGHRGYPFPAAGRRRHPHAALHKTAAEGRAQARSGADDDRDFVCCHPCSPGRPTAVTRIPQWLISGRWGPTSTATW